MDLIDGMDYAQKDVESLLTDIPTINTKSPGVKRRIVDRWSNSIPTKVDGSDSSSLYYFNFNDSLGYAIVSSDKRIGLLALATEGNINQETELTSPGQILLLENIERSMLMALDSLDDEPPIPTFEYVYGDWTNTFFQPYVGYCESKWGTDAPYNYYCYTDDGLQAQACCVSVAVGQLMSMYQYPSSYSGFAYYWGMMRINPYYANSDGIMYVPRLLSDLGTTQNLDVQYGEDESNSEIAFVPRTFSNFGYSSGGFVSEYNTNQVISELQSGFPLLMGGKSHKMFYVRKILGITVSREFIGYVNGHVWLCHGLLNRQRPVYTYVDGILSNVSYENHWYVLCNFGWDSYGLNIGTPSNGYYSMGIFNTNTGPVFNDSLHQSSINTKGLEYEGTSGFYQYELSTVTGIRKQ